MTFIEFTEENHNRKTMINVETIDEVINTGPEFNHTILRQGTVLRPVLGSYQSTCDTLRAAGCKIIPLLEGEPVALYSDFTDKAKPTKGRKRNDK